MKQQLPFDPTKPVQTRDGRPARIIATDMNSVYPIVAIIKSNDGRSEFESVESYNEHGLCFRCSQNSLDLVNVPEEHTLDLWLNIYADKSVGRLRSSQAEALKAAADVGDVIACVPVKITYTVGEGL